MTESFGARLRQQRERQEITLTSIAERTKISRALFEGLERDDVSHWPSGIFRRAFIRDYAQSVGLDPHEVVREFLELYPDPVEPVPAVPPEADAESVNQRPPTRLQSLVGSAIGSLFGRRLTAEGDAAAGGVTAVGLGLAGASVQRESVAASAQPQVVTASAQPQVVTASTQPQPEPDLSAAAHLCTELGRVLDTHDVAPLLERAAGILDAVGMIVWVWDPQWTALRPACTHGYPDEVLAQMPSVRRDEENATAASFRSAQARIVDGSDVANGAVVVPLMTSRGCVGVLAVELRQRGEQKESVLGLATIFAAQLATLFGFTPLAEAVNA